MARLLYPSLHQPVLTDAQLPEQVTESRWNQAWVDPHATIRRAHHARFIIAGIASGETSYPFPPVVSFSWFQPLSEPVRFLPRLHEANQRAHMIDPIALGFRLPPARSYLIF